jgi:hypothetical protein
MSIQLVGRNNDVAEVNERGQLEVAAMTEPELHYFSKLGSVGYWNSTYSATGGEEVIYIQNTEARPLHIERLVTSSTVASLFTVFKVTSATAAAGTAITPVNPNLSNGTPGQENSFGNASVTGSLSGDTLFVGSIGIALQDFAYDFGGAIILGENDAIAITLTTTGVPQVHVEGHWE